jgi:DNA-binding protein YbaB
MALQKVLEKVYFMGTVGGGWVKVTTSLKGSVALLLVVGKP